MTEPVVVTAVFTPKEGVAPKVLAALQVAIPLVHQEEGCVLYAIHDAPNGDLFMIEKWESAELLDAHGEGAAVAGLLAALEGLLERPVEVTRFTPVPVGTAAQGAL